MLPWSIAQSMEPEDPELKGPRVPTKSVCTPKIVARERRLDWAALLKRTFALDVLACDNCGGRLRVMAFITLVEVVRQILEHLRLPKTPPAIAPARDPPQLSLEPDLVDPGPSYDSDVQ